MGEVYDEKVAGLVRQCLDELDRNAEEIYHVTPKGIDTVVDLFRREVEFCSWINSPRPEEGSEHIVAYAIEHNTGRHFIHGDLVGLGIFMMSRLQGNAHAWVVDLMRRLGLRYRCDDASPGEIRETLSTLKEFKDLAKLFYSVLDTVTLTSEFIDDALAALYV
jgi:glycerol dehydrogenase-like iron-containing ADH family enzyme